MINNIQNNDNIDNIDNIDLYHLFNIEYDDMIYDLYNEIDEYSNNYYTYFYNKGNFGKFVNLIYNNIDYENSSIILKNMFKNKIKEYEMDINDYNDDFFEDDLYIN